MDQQVDDLIKNNFDLAILDKYAFIDIATRDTYLLSKLDLEYGLIPSIIINAVMVPSALMLIFPHLIAMAAENGRCGYVKQSRLVPSQTRVQCDWKFIATPTVGFHRAEQIHYARRHDMDMEFLSGMMGLNSRFNTQPEWEREIAIRSKHFWAKASQWTGSDVIINPETGNVDDDGGYTITKFCEAEFENWRHTPMNQSDTFIAMVYNIKARPFASCDQMNYIFLMLNGLSHNISKVVNETTMACVHDMNMRLLYRNRLNDILRRNMTSLAGHEIGRMGKRIIL